MGTNDIDFSKSRRSMGSNISDKEVIENVNQIMKRLPQNVVSTTQSSDELKVENVNISRDIIKCSKCGQSISINENFIKSIKSNISTKFIVALLKLPNFLKKYESNTCRDLVNFLAQSQIETEEFTALRESLNYTTKTRTVEYIYDEISPTAINKGFDRKGLSHYTRQQRINYIRDNLIANDKAYGIHLHGNESYPNNDYRGRGFMHFTHFDAYEDFTKDTGINILETPTLLESDGEVALETATWFWKNKNSGQILKETAKDTKDFQSDPVTTIVTKLVNGGDMALDRRKAAKRSIGSKFVKQYGVCK